ncbi:nose resistant to fluoxetine protein 6 [Trichonephila clavipes]|nr:nose resistant to fluoxetine protein 6 [Trichonephila clavipes]
MDTSSSCPSYDYPWQATFSKISLRFRHELHALKNLSGTFQRYAPKRLTVEAKSMIFIICVFLILAAIGTTITAYDNYYKPPQKRRRSRDRETDIKNQIYSYKEKVSEGKKGFSKALLKKFKAFCNCFCIYTNGRRILSTVSVNNDGDFLWLHGIRLIAALGIIVMHVAIFYGNSFRNLEGLKPWMNTWLMALILNGSCMICVFFVLSGFLNGYYTSRYYFKCGGTISWFQFYWKRFERYMCIMHSFC